MTDRMLMEFEPLHVTYVQFIINLKIDTHTKQHAISHLNRAAQIINQAIDGLETEDADLIPGPI